MPAAAAKAIRLASQTSTWLVTSRPIRTDVKATTPPIEMSISPAITISVSSTAMTPRMLTPDAAVSRFALVMKYGELSHMTIITRTSTATRASPCSRARKRRRRAS